MLNKSVCIRNTNMQAIVHAARMSRRVQYFFAIIFSWFSTSTNWISLTTKQVSFSKNQKHFLCAIGFLHFVRLWYIVVGGMSREDNFEYVLKLYSFVKLKDGIYETEDLYRVFSRTYRLPLARHRSILLELGQNL